MKPIRIATITLITIATIAISAPMVSAAGKLLVLDKSHGKKLGCYVRAAKKLRVREGMVRIYFRCKNKKVRISYFSSSGYRNSAYIQNWRRWQNKTRHCNNPCR